MRSHHQHVPRTIHHLYDADRGRATNHGNFSSLTLRLFCIAWRTATDHLRWAIENPAWPTSTLLQLSFGVRRRSSKCVTETLGSTYGRKLSLNEDAGIPQLLGFEATAHLHALVRLASGT